MSVTFPFSVIIPTRGDRPLFKKLLHYNIKNCPAADIILVDFKPTDTKNDLLHRLLHGAQQAKYSFVAIMEDDDYYPAAWWSFIYHLTTIYPGNVCYGIKEFTYYHLGLNAFFTWQKFDNSALFCSLFHQYYMIERLQNYTELTTHAPDMPIDNYLWIVQPAQRLLSACPCQPIGLKHGTGKKAGNSHSEQLYQNFDTDMQWLKNRLLTDPEALEIIMEIKKQLK